MSPVGDIVLPAELRPADGRFGAGPSKIRPAALAGLGDLSPGYLGTSHRQKPVKSMVGRLRAGLAELFALPEGYEVVVGNGGAAIFWDVATLSLIERRSQHVVCGQFSSSFAEAVAAAPFLDAPEVIEAPAGSGAAPVARAGVDTYALIHNETSTGVALAVVRPPKPEGGGVVGGGVDGGGVDDGGGDALVLVDGTSAAAGMVVDPTQFDVYYFSPQKGLAADGGLWLALCSPAALDRARRLATSDRWIPPGLSLAVAADNSAADQTYNTPGLVTLALACDTVEWILASGGLAWAAARCATSSGLLYDWAQASDYASAFVAEEALRSPVVATIDFDPAVDAAALARILRANGIVDVEPYRRLGRNQLRISTYPAVDPADVEVLIAAIDHVVAALAGKSVAEADLAGRGEHH
ncbi:MAG: phosphoserine transaminase [Acidimicrobiales bacterium]